MIETKLLSRDDLPKTAVGRRARPRSESYESRRAVKHYTHSGGVTTCTRCPPRTTTTAELRFCEDCARINKARFQAGLITPPADQTDHPNNIINPRVAGSYRGQHFGKAYRHASGDPCVTACIKRHKGGWRQGVVRLNGKEVYVGPKTQSQDEAWEYATSRAKSVREGLAYESLLADVGVL